MPPKRQNHRIQIMIRSTHSTPMFTSAQAPPSPPPLSVDSDEDNSDTDNSQSAKEILTDLRIQLEKLSVDSKEIRHQVRNVFRCAKVASVDWMNTPLQPRSPYGNWMRQAGLPPAPTLTEFTEKLFGIAQTMDLAKRQLTFKQSDAEALWDGKRTITVFELMAALPTFFH